MQHPPSPSSSSSAHPIASAATPWQAYAALSISMALVGSYSALAKILLLIFPVFLLMSLRFGLAGVVMLPWLKKKPDERHLTNKTKHLLFLGSFLGNFLFSIFMLLGVSMTSAVSSGIILASIPAAVALLSWIFLKETLSPRLWFGIACSVFGVALLALSATANTNTSPTSTSMSWLGNLFVFGAVVCEASYAVIGKSLTQNLSPKRITAIINLWGFVLTLPLGLWAAWYFDFSAPSLQIWMLFVFYALAASIFAIWLWMHGVQHVEAGKAGVFTVFVPIGAAAVGIFFLDESLSGIQIAAFTLAFLGVLLAAQKQ